MVLIFDSEDYKNSQDMVIQIALALKEFNSKGFQKDLKSRPPFSGDLVIKINQSVP